VYRTHRTHVATGCSYVLICILMVHNHTRVLNRVTSIGLHILSQVCRCILVIHTHTDI